MCGGKRLFLDRASFGVSTKTVNGEIVMIHIGTCVSFLFLCQADAMIAFAEFMYKTVIRIHCETIS